MAVGVRTRPLVAVISRVPLFVEAVSAAFVGIADVQPISADDVEAHGLVRAFRPDAVIAEGSATAFVAAETPCARVDLEAQELYLPVNGEWRLVERELSPEVIRNAIVARLYGGDFA